ncbi:MAG: CPBP family intramembrane metalloprotease [Acidobacteria bacterium]|nr:CPBP family intramembrane metalloprotease [Acidobacteriota bacterium]
MILAVAHILVAFTALVMPWLGRHKYQKLQQQLTAGMQGARLRFYRVSVAQQSALVAIVLLLAQGAFLPWRALGLSPPDSWKATQVLLLTLTAAIGGSIILFHLTGDRFLRALLKMAGALIPSTAAERVWFAIVSLGAGASEELLFRGFLIWYLGFFLPHLPLLGLIVVSSLIFGICHLYQGGLGVAATALVGAVLAWMYVVSGSLLLPVTIHALLDLRILAIFTPQRMRSLERYRRQMTAAQATDSQLPLG